MKQILFLLLILPLLLLPTASQAETNSSNSPILLYATTVTVTHIFYQNNTAEVQLNMRMNGVGNWSCCFWVDIQEGRFALPGQIKIQPIHYSGADTQLGNSENNTTFYLPIEFDSAYYPFDTYHLSFNLTFPGMFRGVTMPNNTYSRPAYLSRQLNSQFSIQGNESWTTSGYDPVDSFSITVERQGWVGWATLIPIYLLFLIIGFLALMPVERGLSAGRTVTPLLVFVILLGYFWTIAPSLPPVSTYLPLVQVLTYAGLSATTLFLVFSILNQGRFLSSPLADSLSTVSAIVAVDVFLYTLVFSNLPIGGQTYAELLYLQWAVIGLLVLGPVLRLLKWAATDKLRILKRTLSPLVLGAPPSAVVNWLFGVSIALNTGAILLTEYLTQIYGPGIESTPLRRIIFLITAGEPSYGLALNLIVTAALFGALYAVRLVNKKLWAAAGIALFVLSILDFINDSSLFWLMFDPIVLIAVPLFMVMAWVLHGLKKHIVLRGGDVSFTEDKQPPGTNASTD